jgi:hypothetical protein
MSYFRKIKTIALVFLTSFVFCSCSYFVTPSNNMPMGVAPIATIAAVDAMSLMQSKKTLGDHVVSYMKDMDCSSVRREQGDYYCLEKTKSPKPEPVAYCYKTLAGSSCYDRANPYGYDKRVGTSYTNAY